MTGAEMKARGARVTRRPWGLVILTDAGRNSEAFRREALAWLATPEGAAWLATESAPASGGLEGGDDGSRFFGGGGR